MSTSDDCRHRRCASLRRTRSIAAGSTQSLKGAPLRRRRVCGQAPARNAKDRRSSRHGRTIGDVQPNDPAVLADHDAVGIGMTRAGRPTALAVTEYLLLSKRTRQVFETDAGTAWNPSNLPA